MVGLRQAWSNDRSPPALYIATYSLIIKSKKNNIKTYKDLNAAHSTNHHNAVSWIPAAKCWLTRPNVLKGVAPPLGAFALVEIRARDPVHLHTLEVHLRQLAFLKIQPGRQFCQPHTEHVESRHVSNMKRAWVIYTYRYDFHKLAQLCNPTAKGPSKVPGLFRFCRARISPRPWRLKPNRFAVGKKMYIYICVCVWAGRCA